MAQTAAWIRLDRHARRDDRVWSAEDADDSGRVETAAEYLEESPRPVERVGATGEAPGRQFGGRHTVERRPADVKRLRHRAEVHPDSRAEARRNPESVPERSPIQLQQPGGRHG